MRNTIKCSIESCSRESKVKGYCNAHYTRSRKGLNMEVPLRSSTTLADCSVDSCDRESRSSGLCSLHYKRLLRNADLNAPIRGDIGVCEVENCERKAICKKRCNAHYIRKRLNMSDLAPIEIREPGLPCIVDNCGRDRDAFKMCRVHYQAVKRKARYDIILEKIGDFCKSCNIKYPVAVYDFHHINPSTKLFSIGGELLNHRMDVILKEVEKCVLLCANCHRLHHNDNSIRQ